MRKIALFLLLLFILPITHPSNSQQEVPTIPSLDHLVYAYYQGEHLLIGSRNSTLYLYDISGTLLKTIDAGNPIYAIGYSDGVIALLEASPSALYAVGYNVSGEELGSLTVPSFNSSTIKQAKIYVVEDAFVIISRHTTGTLIIFAKKDFSAFATYTTSSLEVLLIDSLGGALLAYELGDIKLILPNYSSGSASSITIGSNAYPLSYSGYNETFAVMFTDYDNTYLTAIRLSYNGTSYTYSRTTLAYRSYSYYYDYADYVKTLNDTAIVAYRNGYVYLSLYSGSRTTLNDSISYAITLAELYYRPYVFTAGGIYELRVSNDGLYAIRITSVEADTLDARIGDYNYDGKPDFVYSLSGEIYFVYSSANGYIRKTVSEDDYLFTPYGVYILSDRLYLYSYTGTLLISRELSVPSRPSSSFSFISPSDTPLDYIAIAYRSVQGLYVIIIDRDLRIASINYASSTPSEGSLIVAYRGDYVIYSNGTVKVFSPEDRLPPSISLKLDNLIEPGSLANLSISIEDRYIAEVSVSVYLDDELVYSYTAEPYTSSYNDTLTLFIGVEGVYKVLVKAVDDANNFALEAAYIYADNSSPIISIVYPESLEYLSKAKINVSISDITFNYSIAKIVKPDGNASVYRFDEPNYSLSLLADELGNRTIIIDAYDKLGHNSSKTITINVYDDIPPRILDVELPAKGIKGKPLDIYVKAVDNHDVKVEIYVSRDNSTRQKIDPAFNGSVRIASYVPEKTGTLYIKIVAYDSSGNSVTLYRVIEVGYSKTVVTIAYAGIIAIIAAVALILIKRRFSEA